MLELASRRLYLAVDESRTSATTAVSSSFSSPMLSLVRCGRSCPGTGPATVVGCGSDLAYRRLVLVRGTRTRIPPKEYTMIAQTSLAALVTVAGIALTSTPAFASGAAAAATGCVTNAEYARLGLGQTLAELGVPQPLIQQVAAIAESVRDDVLDRPAGSPRGTRPGSSNTPSAPPAEVATPAAGGGGGCAHCGCGKNK